MRYARRKTGEAGACFFPSASLRLGVHSCSIVSYVDCIGEFIENDVIENVAFACIDAPVQYRPPLHKPSPPLPTGINPRGGVMWPSERGRGTRGPPVPSPCFPIRDRGGGQGRRAATCRLGSARACSQRNRFWRAQYRSATRRVMTSRLMDGRGSPG